MQRLGKGTRPIPKSRLSFYFGFQFKLCWTVDWEPVAGLWTSDVGEFFQHEQGPIENVVVWNKTLGCQNLGPHFRTLFEMCSGLKTQNNCNNFATDGLWFCYRVKRQQPRGHDRLGINPITVLNSGMNVVLIIVIVQKKLKYVFTDFANVCGRLFNAEREATRIFDNLFRFGKIDLQCRHWCRRCRPAWSDSK